MKHNGDQQSINQRDDNPLADKQDCGKCKQANDDQRGFGIKRKFQIGFQLHFSIFHTDYFWW